MHDAPKVVNASRSKGRIGGVNKITQRADFDAVMSAGVVATSPHFALHLQKPALVSRIGAVVPKRWAKRAVTRNTIKRQIYALADNLTPHADHVVRLRREFDRKLFVSATSNALRLAVREELVQLFAKLEKQ
jgi:ribonuclease P protein component